MENFVLSFHIVATLVMGLNFAWWTNRGWHNLALKIIFGVGAVMGIIVLLHDFGFIVKG